MSNRIPRNHVLDAILYTLNQNGKTIDEIPKNQLHNGDESQQEYQKKPLWHNRSDLIISVAKLLKLNHNLWGPNRNSNRFHNIMDQEISKLRNNGIIVDWNSSKHLGIFRLAHLSKHPVPKPGTSMAGVIPASSAQPANVDMSQRNLKEKFLSIIAKSSKSNTYKFTFAKSLLDYCQENSITNIGKSCEIPYEYFAGKFLKYYWNQEYKFKMKQDFRVKGKPQVIKAINHIFGSNPIGDFEHLDGDDIKAAEKKILNTVFGSIASKKSIVVPAFQEIPTGDHSEEIKIFYDYDNDKKAIYLKPEAFEFFKNNYGILSRAVIAEWAKYLEKINNKLPRLVAKIEYYDAQRMPLAGYRKIFLEHDVDHCFYCGDKLVDNYIHVDHFIPWSYIFDDNLWNLVLTCSGCNRKKSNSLPQEEFQTELIRRNKRGYDQISKLRNSLDLLDMGKGWKPEIMNHYTSCKEYGFSVICLP